MSDRRSILKSASVISLFTIVSRVTGFVRDMLLAGIFGTGPAAQAFFVAFKIPNMLRDIMGEGAGNAAFVPVFCDYLERRPRADFQVLAQRVLGMLLISSGALVAVGMIASPWVIRLVAPGFLDDPDKFRMTITLNRLLFPYLLLVTVAAYLMALENALKSFAIPAATPVIFNLIMIGGIMLAASHQGTAVYAVSAAVLVAGFGQIGFQLPSLKRLGLRWMPEAWRPSMFRDQGIRKIGRLMAPRILGTSVYQLNIFTDTIVGSLAAWVGDGAIAAIYFANRLVQLPFAVFGVALSNAALPHLSSYVSRQETGRFHETLLFCLKGVFLGAIPVMFGFLVLSRPLVQAIFERGSFTSYSTDITARALFFYALGLIGYVGARFLSHGFYALHDTMTPVRTAAKTFGVNLVLIGLLVFVLRWGLAGLALSSAIAATINFLWLYTALKKRSGFGLSRDFARFLWRVVAAAAGMGWGIGVAARGQWLGRPETLAGIVVLTLAGMALYAALLWALKVRELGELWRWISKAK